MNRLVLPSSFAREIIAHAQEGSPLEVCGILAAKDGRIAQVYRAHNIAQSPVTYTMDPKDQVSIFKDMEERGWELWAIYHSHPATEARPSATDIRMAYYPEAYYVIVSLARPEKALIRAFRILGGHALEEKLLIA